MTDVQSKATKSPPAQIMKSQELSSTPRSVRAALVAAAERYGLCALLAALIVVFSVLPGSSAVFASRANLTSILGQEAVLAVVALAFTLPLMVGQLDLSLASVAGLASIGTASAMSRFHLPLVAAVAVGIAIGLLVGAMNGYFIAIIRLDSIIVTLAVMTIIAGVIQWYTNGISISSGISETLTNFGSLTWLGIPRVTYLLAVIIAITWYVVEMTPFGKYIRMIGSNRAAARLVGIAVPRVVFSVFLFAGALAGVAGVLLTAQAGSANPQEGPGLLLSALAAVYLGATTIQTGRFNVLGTVVGVFFLAVAVSGLAILGVPSFVGNLFDGAALLTAIGLSRVFGRSRRGGVVGT